MEVKTTMCRSKLERTTLRRNTLTLFFRNGNKVAMQLEKGDAMELVQKLWKIVND